MNEDIFINVEAKYQSLQGLLNQLERAKSSFKNLGGAKIDKDLRKMIQKAADPIAEASKQLEIAQKNVEKAQAKLREGLVSGAQDVEIARLQQNVAIAEQREKVVIKTVEHTKQLLELEQQISQQYAEYTAAQEREAAAQAELERKMAAAQENLQKVMLTLDPVKQKAYELQQAMQAAQEEFIKLDMAGESTKGAENAIKRIKKQMDSLQESTKKSSSWVSTLMGRIRNISIYRAIRSGIKWLTSGVSEGLQGLAQYSDGVNSSMSNINNSLGQIRNTLAISFASVLQALEPTITALSDALVDLINSFNLAMAKMQGKDFYTKAKKSADSYAESAKKAQKLSFDTFETLSGGDDKTETKDLFEKGSVNEDATELSNTFGKIFEAIKQIWDIVQRVVKYLWESGILDAVFSIITPILEVVNILLDYLQPALEWIADFIGSIAEQISGAFSLIGGLLKLLTGDFQGAWDSIKKGFIKMGQGIVNIFIDILNIVVTVINSFLKPIDWIASLFGVEKGTVQIPKIPHVSFYANGGIPAQGELFYMNEGGVPEALVNTGGSQTNVINIEQLSEGMRRGFVQAIYDTGLLNALGQGGTTLVVDKDVLGRIVAESAGFRNEVNRRNTSLNLR